MGCMKDEGNKSQLVMNEVENGQVLFGFALLVRTISQLERGIKAPASPCLWDYS